MTAVVALASIEALLLVALVAIAALFVAALMYRLRFEGEPRPLAPWIPAVLLTIAAAGLMVAFTVGNGWNVATFALLTVSFGALLLQALRARRSGG